MEMKDLYTADEAGDIEVNKYDKDEYQKMMADIDAKLVIKYFYSQMPTDIDSAFNYVYNINDSFPEISDIVYENIWHNQVFITNVDRFVKLSNGRLSIYDKHLKFIGTIILDADVITDPEANMIVCIGALRNGVDPIDSNWFSGIIVDDSFYMKYSDITADKTSDQDTDCQNPCRVIYKA